MGVHDLHWELRDCTGLGCKGGDEKDIIPIGKCGRRYMRVFTFKRRDQA